jgi:hypothetical protein
LTRVFLALCRHPVMQAPQPMQVLRAGPAPPKNGSGASLPGSWPGRPKNTPTGVGWNVWATPISVATCSITSSDGVRSGFWTTPSIRLAWS